MMGDTPFNAPPGELFGDDDGRYDPQECLDCGLVNCVCPIADDDWDDEEDECR